MLIRGNVLRALLVAGCMVAAPVYAADFTVNTEMDEVDVNPGDGVCETAAGNGQCSLRAAVMEANAWVMDAVDNILLPAGTYMLTISGRDEQFGEEGDLDVSTAMVITGLAGRDQVIVDGNRIDRIFEVLGTDVSGGAVPGTGGNGNLTLNSMTLRNGNIPSFSTTRPVGAVLDGGAINNTGNLVVNDVVIADNESGSNGGGISSLFGNVEIRNSIIEENGTFSSGGGVAVAEGVLTIDNTTIRGNFGAAFPGLIFGGGVSIINPGTKATIRNSLITDHVVVKDGGGIWVLAGAVELINTTISENQAGRSGGGVYINGGDVNVTGGSGTTFPESLLANVTITENLALGLGDNDVPGEPRGNSIYVNSGNVGIVNSLVDGMCEVADGAALVSLGNNIDSDSTCGFGEETDMPGAGGGQLLPLADNGGSTLTYALVSGSVAEDAADDTVCHDPGLTASVDQRGFTRPETGCDIGAYETEAIEGAELPPPTDSGNSENVPPKALNIVFSTAVGQPLVGMLLASDPDGDELMFDITRNGSKGTASLLPGGEAGAFTYTPNAGELGTDSFDYLACEVATGACSILATATVFIVDAPSVQSVTVELSPAGAAIGGTTSQVLTVNQAELNSVVPDIDYTYPLGAFFFSVSDIPTDPLTPTLTEVVLQLPDTAEVADDAVVRKLNTLGEWETLGMGPSSTVSTAVVDPVNKTITLTLIDNDPFDRNPLDGVIDDPVALGVPMEQEATTGENEEEMTDTEESIVDSVNDFLESGGGGALSVLVGLAVLGGLMRRRGGRSILPR